MRLSGRANHQRALGISTILLGLLGGAGLKCRGKPSEQGNEDRAHCENDDDLTNNLTSVFSTLTEFSATKRRGC